MLKLSDFDYTLPEELIAQYPLQEREAARLLVVDRFAQRLEHRFFRDLPEYLRQHDLLVLNDTRVLPARLMARRATGGKVELLLVGRKNGLTFQALIRPARVRLHETLLCNGGSLSAVVTGANEVTFQSETVEQVYRYGMIPLPPYIKRPPEAMDAQYYQTVYARHDGSIAAPTAGLHFTDELLKKIPATGAALAYVTLHIGYATFKPVKDYDITQHRMDPEYFCVPPVTAEKINAACAQGGRVIAVGTTSLRCLEASTCPADNPSPAGAEGYTDLFIYPGYRFQRADCLLTNFHLPRTTLFMLACAFGGQELIQKAYAEAVRQRYRFYSYGDAMLII